MFLNLKNDSNDSIFLKFILEILEFSKSNELEEIKKNEEKKKIIFNYFKDILLCTHNYSIEK